MNRGPVGRGGTRRRRIMKGLSEYTFRAVCFLPFVFCALGTVMLGVPVWNVEETAPFVYSTVGHGALLCATGVFAKYGLSRRKVTRLKIFVMFCYLTMVVEVGQVLTLGEYSLSQRHWGLGQCHCGNATIDAFVTVADGHGVEWSEEDYPDSVPKPTAEGSLRTTATLTDDMATVLIKALILFITVETIILIYVTTAARRTEVQTDPGQQEPNESDSQSRDPPPAGLEGTDSVFSPGVGSAAPQELSVVAPPPVGMERSSDIFSRTSSSGIEEASDLLSQLISVELDELSGLSSEGMEGLFDLLDRLPPVGSEELNDLSSERTEGLSTLLERLPSLRTGDSPDSSTERTGGLPDLLVGTPSVGTEDLSGLSSHRTTSLSDTPTRTPPEETEGLPESSSSASLGKEGTSTLNSTSLPFLGLKEFPFLRATCPSEVGECPRSAPIDTAPSVACLTASFPGREDSPPVTPKSAPAEPTGPKSSGGRWRKLKGRLAKTVGKKQTSLPRPVYKIKVSLKFQHEGDFNLSDDVKEKLKDCLTQILN